MKLIFYYTTSWITTRVCSDLYFLKLLLFQIFALSGFCLVKYLHCLYYFQDLHYYFELKTLINITCLSKLNCGSNHVFCTKIFRCACWSLRARRRTITKVVFIFFVQLNPKLDINRLALQLFFKNSMRSKAKDLDYLQPTSCIVNSNNASLLGSIINKIQ